MEGAVKTLTPSSSRAWSSTNVSLSGPGFWEASAAGLDAAGRAAESWALRRAAGSMMSRAPQRLGRIRGVM